MSDDNNLVPRIFSEDPGDEAKTIYTIPFRALFRACTSTRYKQNGGGWSKTSGVFAAFSLFSGRFESSTLGKGKIVCHSYYCEDRQFK